MVGAVVDPAMGQGDHQIGPGGAQAGHQAAGGFRDACAVQAPSQVVAVPDGDLRRHQPDHADPQVMRLTGGVGETAFKDQGAREGQRRVAKRVDIGAGDGEARRFQRAAKRGQAEVEFVIAQPHGVVIQCVHRRDHRMRAGPAVGLAGHVAERRALKEIAIVEKQAVGGFAAGLADKRGQTRQTQRSVILAGMIIERHDVTVKVGRLQQPQMQKSAGAGVSQAPVFARFGHVMFVALGSGTW